MKKKFEQTEIFGNSATKELKITGQQGKPLSKTQIAFNDLTNRIERLNKEIEAEKTKCETLLKEYSKDIPEKKKKLAETQLQIAKALAAAYGSIKFSARQKKQIETVILWFCSEAFSVIEPNEETKAFYDSWSAMSYEEELEEQKNDMKFQMAMELNLRFGIDISMDEIDDSPEGFAKLKERLEKEMESAEQEASSKQRKTKKQIAQEDKLKKEETEKIKSLRSIYISLAKMLHPDTVADEKEKAEKEELMKKVTVAYNEKNLSELLKLELQWAASEKNNIDNLTEDKLKLYIASLREQVSELQDEKLKVIYHPRYSQLGSLLFASQQVAIKKIKNLSKELNSILTGNSYLVNMLNNSPSKKTVVELVDEWAAHIELRENDILFDNTPF